MRILTPANLAKCVRTSVRLQETGNNGLRGRIEFGFQDQEGTRGSSQFVPQVSFRGLAPLSIYTDPDYR